MIFAAVLAGGTGVRMGSAMPKQFLPLGIDNEPILIHTLRPFLADSRIDRTAVGVHPDWLEYTQALIRQYFPEQADQIPVVAGGADRSETMLRVISCLEEFCTEEPNFLLTHDGVRPFVTPKMIADSIDTVQQYGACTVAYSAIDTILVSEDGQTISDIPNRNLLWQTQTPQTFRMEQLRDVYTSLSDEEKKILTDANKIFLLRGIPVHLVPGSPRNLKITTMDDYRMACAIAAQESSQTGEVTP